MENTGYPQPSVRMAPWIKSQGAINTSGSQQISPSEISVEPPASPTPKRNVITEVLHSPTLELVIPELRVTRMFEGDVGSSMGLCPFDVAYYWDQSAEEIEVRVYQQINCNKHRAIPPSVYVAEEGERRKELLAQKIEARRREEEEENLRKKKLEDEVKKRNEEAWRRRKEDEKKAAEGERQKAEDERKKAEDERKKAENKRKKAEDERKKREQDAKKVAAGRQVPLLDVHEENSPTTEEKLASPRSEEDKTSEVVKRKDGKISLKNVQPAVRSWIKVKKDKKKEKEKKTTLVNWDNLMIGETVSKVSAGSGTSMHVCYVDGFQCCMKELNFSFATVQQKRMIRGEIELLESLEPHRNVVRYLHHQEGKTYIRLFLTMYSATLSDLLKKRKEANSPLSAIDICFYCRLCLNGLQFLHGHGIIHRDIKAENVFLILGSNGKVLEVALGDFDQAKNLGGVMTVTTIGTLGWMAPEILGGQGYSFAADIYSFGMLLYEMISLTIPFEKESQFSLPDKVAKGLQPKIPEEVHDLPGYPELISLQRECIAVQPAERPPLDSLQQSFGEVFARLLEETEESQPL